MERKKSTKYIATEAEEQKVLVEWLELKGLKFTAIPNSTYTTSWKQKQHNTEMGLRAGLSDLLVLTNHFCLFIEMKRKKKSVISEEQKQWIKALNNCFGVRAMVCYGADEAITFIEGNSAPIKTNLKYQQLYENNNSN